MSYPCLYYLSNQTERQRVCRTYNGIEKSGLADIREANDAGFEAHAYLR